MRKFLIIRFSSIGDIVLTTPVIRCLKQQIPDAEVHVLTKPALKQVLEHNPYIDHLHLLDKPLLVKAIELKSMGFECIIDLHNNLRTRIIKSILDITAYSFNKLNFEKSILVKLKSNLLPLEHIVDRYMNTVAALGVLNDGKGLDYFLPNEITFPSNVKLPSSYTAFAIGAQHFTKRLPNAKIIDICKQSTNTIVLLGGKEDAANGALIASQSGPHVLNLCGKLSLAQSALAVKQASVVITHDTGLMHIAAAFKKPIVSVWGNTVPEFGMTPYYGTTYIRNAKFEIRNLSCRPCSKIGFNNCPKKHFNCMQLQNSTAIAQEAIQSIA